MRKLFLTLFILLFCSTSFAGTHGRTTTGASTASADNAIYVLSCPETDLTGQQATKITAYIAVSTATHKVKCVLYDAEGDVIGLTNEVSVTTQAATWTDFEFSTPVSLGNVAYGIGIMAEDSSGDVTCYYGAWDANYSTYYKTGLSYPTFPDPLSGASNTSGDVSIYLTYEDISAPETRRVIVIN